MATETDTRRLTMTMHCMVCGQDVVGGVLQHERRWHGGAQTCRMATPDGRRAARCGEKVVSAKQAQRDARRHES